MEEGSRSALEEKRNGTRCENYLLYFFGGFFFLALSYLPAWLFVIAAVSYFQAPSSCYGDFVHCGILGTANLTLQYCNLVKCSECLHIKTEDEFNCAPVSDLNAQGWVVLDIAFLLFLVISFIILRSFQRESRTFNLPEIIPEHLWSFLALVFCGIFGILLIKMGWSGFTEPRKCITTKEKQLDCTLKGSVTNFLCVTCNACYGVQSGGCFPKEKENSEIAGGILFMLGTILLFISMVYLFCKFRERCFLVWRTYRRFELVPSEPTELSNLPPNLPPNANASATPELAIVERL